MKPNKRPIHSIVVSAQSENWCSMIRRKIGKDAELPIHAPVVKVSWLLHAKNLIDEAIKSDATVAIVEISSANILETCQKLAPLANNSYQLKLFAIGDGGLSNWQPLLRAAGFAGWYWSLLQSQELCRAIRAHQRNTPRKLKSIEDCTTALLPWRAAKPDLI
ncbi:MAG: hypothetical protein AB8B55_22605 [Mariniblastus sp.]